MRILFDSDGRLEIAFTEAELKNLYRASKKRITVRPKLMSAVCEVDSLNEAKILCGVLKQSLKSIQSSSFYMTDSYYLCIKLLTADADKLLSYICEHSERVYVGYDYQAVIKEHAYELIISEAIEILSSS